MLFSIISWVNLTNISSKLDQFSSIDASANTPIIGLDLGHIMLDSGPLKPLPIIELVAKVEPKYAREYEAHESGPSIVAFSRATQIDRSSWRLFVEYETTCVVERAGHFRTQCPLVTAAFQIVHFNRVECLSSEVVLLRLTVSLTTEYV